MTEQYPNEPQNNPQEAGPVSPYFPDTTSGAGENIPPVGWWGQPVPPPFQAAEGPCYRQYSPPPAPPRRRRRRGVEAALIALSMAVVVLLALLLGGLMMVSGTLNRWARPVSSGAYPPGDAFSVLHFQGSITNGGGQSGYQHQATLEYIRALTKSGNDKGILLFMNTPGGGVYESDEIYRALMDYREKTGGPVWAYMAQVCASGGYYVCMAAENLMANYNTTTGSIGVYIALTDVSELYGKLGIETVLLRSGDNKGIGVAGVPITEEQRKVYQSSIDESYARFVDLIVEARGMDRQEVLGLADGRSYTATQALKKGLIDEKTEWESALAAFEEKTGAKAYYPDFSRQTHLDRMFSGFLSELPRGETESALSLAEALPQGVPLVYAYELAG